MTNLHRSFSTIERRLVSEIDSRSVEQDSDPTQEHEIVENPETWNPPVLHATDIYIYKTSISYIFRKKVLLKVVEVKIKIIRSAHRETCFRGVL